MSKNTDLVKAELEERRQVLREAGADLKKLLPGGHKLTDNEAVTLAQYSQLTGANPFRGEMYGFKDKFGNFRVVDGYKLLIREAKSQCDYTDQYEKLAEGEEGLTSGDIGYRCLLLRNDKLHLIKSFVDSGATFQEAKDTVTNLAVGIVKKEEMWSEKKKKAIDPPKGWSWEQVARKRALKFAIQFAYSLPSPEDLAKRQAEQEGVQTKPEDWPDEDTYNTHVERKEHALLAAKTRNHQARVAAMNETERDEYQAEIRHATNLMRNDGDDDPLDLDEPEPESAEIYGTGTPEDGNERHSIDISNKDLEDYYNAYMDDLAERIKGQDKPATDIQKELLVNKLEETFAGEMEVQYKAETVLRWFTDQFDDAKVSVDEIYDTLLFSEAKALLSRMLCKKDESGDFPLRPEFVKIAHAIVTKMTEQDTEETEW